MDSYTKLHPHCDPDSDEYVDPSTDFNTDFNCYADANPVPNPIVNCHPVPFNNAFRNACATHTYSYQQSYILLHPFTVADSQSILVHDANTKPDPNHHTDDNIAVCHCSHVRWPGHMSRRSGRECVGMRGV